MFSKGRTIRGRVVDEVGQPVKGASVTVPGWRGLKSLQWRAETDAEGRFSWDAAPADPFEVSVSKPGVEAMTHRIDPALSKEYSLYLPVRTIMIEGRVVDAGTGEPIRDYFLFSDEHHSRSDWDYPVWQMVFQVNRAGDRFKAATSRNNVSSAAFMVRAEGYLPAETGIITTKGRHEFTFALRRGGDLSGTVVTAQGTRVEGAQVACLGTGRLSLGAGRIVHNDGDSKALTETDAKGHFAVPALVTEPRLVAIHEEHGYAETTEEDLASGNPLVLRPWGGVEGTLRIGNAPGTNVLVGLRSEMGPERWLELDFEKFQQTTDAEGHFSFSKVPRGRYQLVRWIKVSRSRFTPSHPQSVTVEPGQTTHVAYGGVGRTVVGRLELKDAKVRPDWSQSGDRGFGSRAPYPPEDARTRAEIREWRTSAAYRAAAESHRNYSWDVAKDGSFRVEDVAPGDYALTMRVPQHEVTGENGQQVRIPNCTAHMTFSLPEVSGADSEVPFDLGTVQLWPIRALDAYGREVNPALPLPPQAGSQAVAVGDRVDLSKAERNVLEDNRLWFTVTFEGKPVAGAEVQLARETRTGDGVKLSAVAKTDEKGRMFVHSDANAESVVIRDGNRFAEVPFASLTNHSVVALQAEAQLSGTLRIGGSPWPHQQLRIEPRYRKPTSPGENRPPIQVTTDAEGRFGFPALAAGPAEVLLVTPPFATRNPPPRFGGVLHGYSGVSQRLASINLPGGKSSRLDLDSMAGPSRHAQSGRTNRFNRTGWRWRCCWSIAAGHRRSWLRDYRLRMVRSWSPMPNHALINSSSNSIAIPAGTS
ncbi:MAG: carboxypeptidase regulatory-like domain-containing protein [Verrucomicrobiales bacterium]|nr:carboxypeptidase regulatory-like domain-containing protein [Verrucomicrobiales bacterium]